MNSRIIPRRNAPFCSKGLNIPFSIYGGLTYGNNIESFEPTKLNFARLFKALGNQGNLIEGMKLHDCAQSIGLVKDALVVSSVVSFYGRFGAILEAEHVFAMGFKPIDVVLWNAMLSVYVKNGEGEKVLLLYRQMREEGMHPNAVTFVICLQACGILTSNVKSENGQKPGKEEKAHKNQCLISSWASEVGRALHSDALRIGFAFDVRIVSTLISMYGKCGMVQEAEHVFSIMSPHHHNVVSWNAMLSAYVEEGRGDKALLLYTRMVKEEGVEPDHLSIVFALRACGILVAENKEVVPIKSEVLVIGRALHMVSESMGFSENVFLGTTLVNVYGKCGSIVDAEYAFQALSERTVVSWNSMLCIYVEHGHVENALLLYRQMKESSYVNEDQHTLMFVIHACTALMEREKTLADEHGYRVKVISELGHALHADARKKTFLL